MSNVETAELLERATVALTSNRIGDFTAPNRKLYPHDWLWDTALHILGEVDTDPRRGATELMHTLDGQWSNGMIPNMRFENPSSLEQLIWCLPAGHPEQPRDQYTSAISQPPMLAVAVQIVAEKLEPDDKKSFLRAAVPRLIAYHGWIYQERDFGNNGLFAAVHPYETGRDNDLALMQHTEALSWGLSRGIGNTAGILAGIVRHDIRHVSPEQRSSNRDAQLQAIAYISLRRNRFMSDRLRTNHPFHVEDVGVNSILVANNTALRELADEVGVQLNDELLDSMSKTAVSLELLWDESDERYYSRDAVTGKLLKTPSAASLLPLYSCQIPTERIPRLIGELNDKATFNLPYGVPSLAANDPDYKPLGYWNGAVWPFTTYLLAEGAYKSGHPEVANALYERFIGAVFENDFFEYFSAETGEPGGISPFSPTAALVVYALKRRLAT